MYRTTGQVRLLLGYPETLSYYLQALCTNEIYILKNKNYKLNQLIKKIKIFLAFYDHIVWSNFG